MLYISGQVGYCIGFVSTKRQVLYMARHKYIYSTEMYEVQEPETLTDQLAKHHSFG